MPLRRATMYVDGAHYRRLRAALTLEGRTVSDWVRACMACYLAAHTTPAPTDTTGDNPHDAEQQEGQDVGARDR